MSDRIEKKAFVQQLAARMQADEHVASEWLEATLETLYANFKEGRGVTLLVSDAASALQSYVDGDGVTLPEETHIATART